MESFLYFMKRCIPKPLFRLLQPPYHYLLAFLGAFIYRFPSKDIFLIGVTGTKGKSSTIEILNAILEESGKATAIASTIRFKINGDSKPNLYKMTMPGRFFMQRFLREAVDQGSSHALIEMTSEGVRLFRHKFLYLDALIFTNITPEHIESHGSFEKYLHAKLKLAKALEASPKKTRYMVANVDDKRGQLFLDSTVEKKLPFSLKDAHPYNVRENDIGFTIDNQYISSPLQGTFNLYNILAAVTLARARNISTTIIKSALERFNHIPGRVEHIDLGQNFDVVIDYAHTPDSLTQLYETFKKKRKICLLGNTGGGRDSWKRKEMGKIADYYCEKIVLANEDPYDEDPQKILDEMKAGVAKHEVHEFLDRRAGIHKALALAETGDVVLISGKGTDPYIMGPRNTKQPWNDSKVAKEELAKWLEQKEQKQT